MRVTAILRATILMLCESLALSPFAALLLLLLPLWPAMVGI
jgi:hypothetical protein